MKTINTKIDELDRVQSNVSEALSPALAKAILDGELIEGVPLSPGVDNLVSHKLGRAPRGWILARQNSNASVWEMTSSISTVCLNLRCSAGCVVNLWVF